MNDSVGVTSRVICGCLPGNVTALQASISWYTNFTTKHEFVEWAHWPELHSRQSYNSISIVSPEILVLYSHVSVPQFSEHYKNVIFVFRTSFSLFCSLPFGAICPTLPSLWLYEWCCIQNIQIYSGFRSLQAVNHMNLPKLLITCTPL